MHFMIKTYTETIFEKERTDQRTEAITVPQHTVVYEYDTDNIKRNCVDCKTLFPKLEDKEERYKKWGNYCPTCSAKYSQKTTE